jgi:hypothetical protein
MWDINLRTFPVFFLVRYEMGMKTKQSVVKHHDSSPQHLTAAVITRVQLIEAPYLDEYIQSSANIYGTLPTSTNL